ncbi:MAG TPA: DedA family protein [Candidatus Nanoarchaeia archaeon]|nr:DedA family protein [Candidatus Nanoarchaeia archaeon]
MSIVTDFINIVLHLDKFLPELINSFGTWIYIILFVVIFLETGLVFTPFLPGDSLIFTVGAFAAVGSLNITLLLVLLSLAAILGDSVNYSIGHFIGRKIIKSKPKLIKKDYLDKTQQFYDKYGGLTIVIARFIPIVRTFAPFLAGIGTMKYFKFLFYNIIGGILWVLVFLFAGYFFGNIPFVKENFALAIIAIIVVSMIPTIVEILRHWKKGKKELK